MDGGEGGTGELPSVGPAAEPAHLHRNSRAPPHFCGWDGNLICTGSLLASVLPLPGGQVGRGGAHQASGQGTSGVGLRRHPTIHLSHLFMSHLFTCLSCPTCSPVLPVHLSCLSPSHLFICLTCSTYSPVLPVHLSHLFPSKSGGDQVPCAIPAQAPGTGDVEPGR